MIQAQTLAALGDLSGSKAVLAQVRQAVIEGGVVQEPYDSDLEIRISKLERRLALALLGLADAESL